MSRIGLPVFASFVLAACTGTQRKPDPVVVPVWHNHLERVPVEAEFAVTVHGLGDLTKTVRHSNAWEKAFEIVSARSPRIASFRSTIESLADVVERDLSGRMTFAIWTPDDGVERWVFLADGNVQSILRTGERLTRAPAGQLVHVGDDVFQYVGGTGEADAYLVQQGGMGLIASDREALSSLMKPAQSPLPEDQGFVQLMPSIDGAGEVVFWVGDWTDADESWSDMAALTPGEQEPRSALVSVSVEEGLRGRYALEFDESQAGETALPFLKKAEGPMRTPRLLPADTLAFAGLRSGGGSYAELLAPWLEQTRSDTDLFEELLGGLAGELAFAVTAVPPSGTPGALGFPVPEMVVLAEIGEGVDPGQVEPLVGSLFRLAHGEMTGTTDMGPPSQIDVEGIPITVFATVDPQLTVAHAVIDGFLVVGTALAVQSVARARAGDASASLSGSQRDPLATRALGEAWNYVTLVDLEGGYAFVKAHWGYLLSGMSQGAFGAAHDPAEFLFSVAPGAGATLRYEDARMIGEFWVSVRDAR